MLAEHQKLDPIVGNLVRIARRADDARKARTGRGGEMPCAVAVAETDQRAHVRHQMRSILASSITLFQRSMSADIRRRKSSGVPALGSLPRSWIRLIVVGSATVSLGALLSR